MKLIIRIAAFFMLLVICSTLQLYAQSGLQYVQQEIIKVPGKLTDDQLYPLSLSEKTITRQYVDGLGRPLQSIALGASPAQNDLIQFFEYNPSGIQTINYLPYAGKSTEVSGSYRSNAVTEQAAFYNNGPGDKVADDSVPYSQSFYEASPLLRPYLVLGVGTPSGTWQGTNIADRYNTSADGNIIQFDPDGTKAGNYAVNTLSVKEVTNKDAEKILVFTDIAGNTILKRQLANTVIGGVTVTYLDTYYIYNEGGMVAYVIPPKAVALLNANSSYTLTTAAVSSLLFKFTYDTRGRVIEKTVPGTGPVSIIYDPLNRPVLTQNPKLKLTNQWSYIKYDVKGRVASQGLYTDALAPAALQTYVSGLNYSTNWYETRSNNAGTGYYSNNCFPTVITPLGYNYYDDYDLDLNGTDDYSYASQSLTDEGVAITGTRGKLTMTRKRTVGSGLSNIWLTSAVFYDKYGQVIQTQNNNHINISGTLTDINTVVYAFSGSVKQSKVSKVIGTGAANTTTVLSSFFYDHMQRVTAIDQSYNAAATIRIAGYTYNEIGQLVDKQIHKPSGGTTWLQSVDFRYNILGQLTSINNSKLSNDSATANTNDDTNDVFGMELLYDKVDVNVGNTAYYSGKLSAVKWMSLSATGVKSYERSYKYSYDLLNRYTAANYAERTAAGTGSFSNNIGGFNEDEITYDENGNLQTLKRYSSTQGTNTRIQVDNLTYSYDPAAANRLDKVSDGSGANYTGYGFKNLTASTASYAYESTTGNLIADPYKGLAIIYNELNRTDKVTITTAANKYINYTYDAAGQLLRKQTYDNNVLQTTTDYLPGGFVYTKPGTGTTVLSYFAIPEGRVRNAAGVLKNEYTITDQQGNARVTFDNSGTGGTAKVIQENSFYGFGLQLANSPVATGTTPKKEIYNGGSELQDDFGGLPDYYQTFYRNYDAAIGRFVATDPMAEATADMSVYQYANNNPIMLNDPLGNMAHNSVNQSRSREFYEAWNNTWGEMGAEMDKHTYIFFQLHALDNGSSGGGGNGGYMASSRYEPNKTTHVYLSSDGKILRIAQTDGGDGKAHFLKATDIDGSIGIPIEEKEMSLEDAISLMIGGNKGGYTTYLRNAWIKGQPQFSETKGIDASRSNLFAQTWAHYQNGGGRPLTVKASSINVSKISRADLKLQSNGKYLLDMFKLDPYNASSLALGKLLLIDQGHNQFTIEPNEYDFNIEWGQGFSKRNIATLLDGAIHNFSFLTQFRGGSYMIYFSGTITIK